MDEIWARLRRLRDGLAPPPQGFERLEARRARRERTQRLIAGGLALGLFSAGLAWAFTNIGAPQPQPPLATSPASSPPVEPPPSPSVTTLAPPTAGPCEFPPYRPTYLPWLASGGGVPEPDMRRYGPPTTSSAYAILAWENEWSRYEGGPRLKGQVELVRTREPADSFPEHPEVPILPGTGHGGKLSRAPDSPPGSGDWAIVWEDAFPSPIGDGCHRTTLGVSLPNLSSDEVREETLRIARSIVLREVDPPNG